ncbi:MAG: eL32 family ribosomal protein [Candidatus Woesearchaeota archaeon]
MVEAKSEKDEKKNKDGLKGLLQLRAQIKSKKPEFVRQDFGKKLRLAKTWRKPKGLHSKLRHHIKGQGRKPEPGWGSPSEVKGLQNDLIPVLVHNIQEIDRLEPKRHGAVIASSVGIKKKIEIVKVALQRNITLLNLKDAPSWLSAQEQAILAKRQQKSLPKPKEGSVVESKVSPASKERSAEEKAVIEKEEKDKILTKRI